MSRDFNGNVVTINVIDAYGNHAIILYRGMNREGVNPIGENC